MWGETNNSPNLELIYYTSIRLGDKKKKEEHIKFRAYLDLKSLNSVLEGEESSLDVEKNKQVFSELAQRLDDKSLSLTIRDAYGDGRKSMKILRDHYLGSSKPRIISLYCELAVLKMQNGETVTDYLLRAETTASYLKRAGKMISDGLIIAMIIRGLPAAYNAFSTVVTQRDSAEIDFSKFKSALKSEEETKKTRQSHSENAERVMKVKDSKIICYLCGKSGHKKVECKNYSAKKNRWCSSCKSASHDTKFCRKKDTVKAMATDSKDVKGSFCFRVTTDSESASVVDSANLLVDCGATVHIICDKSKFVSLDKNFDPSKHFIELADGSRMNNIVDAKAYLHAKIDCNVFVEQPEGFIELDKDGEKLVYKLKKSLYGLKQSGRNWNNLLHQFLVEQNFVQSLSDTCVYVRESDSGKVIIIVRVDDLILASSNAVVLREVKRLLSNKFKMKDLGPISVECLNVPP
ncbi:Reverse transcriptase RNA-dependent DNA polymerase [Trinorchestia longiramus]|nr:Reverse transcriptase RNA-dependent DNA polymerase [Trinorchestia longiramus]